MADLRQITLDAQAFDVPEEHVELTQAEYDALTPAEKNNGKVYFVTDGQGGGGGGGSDDITIIKSNDLPSWNQLDAIWGTGTDKVVYYSNVTSGTLERIISAGREGERVTILTHDVMNAAFGRKVTLYEFEIMNYDFDAPLELLSTTRRNSDIPEMTTILSTDTTQITESMVRPIYRISGNLTVYELNMRVPALPNNTSTRIYLDQRVNNWENFRLIQFVCGRTSSNLVVNSYSGSVQSTYHQAVVDYVFDSSISIRTFTDMSTMSANLTFRFSGRYIG